MNINVQDFILIITLTIAVTGYLLSNRMKELTSKTSDGGINAATANAAVRLLSFGMGFFIIVIIFKSALPGLGKKDQAIDWSAIGLIIIQFTLDALYFVTNKYYTKRKSSIIDDCNYTSSPRKALLYAVASLLAVLMASILSFLCAKDKIIIGNEIVLNNFMIITLLISNYIISILVSANLANISLLLNLKHYELYSQNLNGKLIDRVSIGEKIDGYILSEDNENIVFKPQGHQTVFLISKQNIDVLVPKQ